jgi:drug/metabolite transporter (DMT)-like permease
VPPTEAEFAAAVARDVAREMLPPAQMAGIILVIVAAVLVILFLWSKRRE